MSLFTFRSLALATFFATFGPHGFADVLVVDVGAGAPFSDPQTAIDAAVDGDTILIKAGGYSGFTIDGKSLGVIADTGVSVPISGRVTVRNIGVNQRVRLGGLAVVGQGSGLNCPGSPTYGGAALLVENSAGAVRIMDCSFRGADAGFAMCGISGGYAIREHSYPGARLYNVRDLAFDECSLTGGDGQILLYTVVHSAGDGGHGVDAEESLVAFHDCEIRGGKGGWADLGGNGGHAYWARGLGGLVSGCTLVGGASADSTDPSYAPPLPGGDAIRTDFGANPAAGVQVQHLDSILQGGAGSTWPYTGGPGMAFAGPGLEVPFTGLAPKLESPRLVREGSTLALNIEGQPGHRAVLIQSGQTRFRPIASMRGIQLVGQGANAVVLETRWLYQDLIPPSGTLQVDIAIPDQGPGFEAALRRYQVLTFLPSTPRATTALGDFAEITILDDSY